LMTGGQEREECESRVGRDGGEEAFGGHNGRFGGY
jgi:hypothetical protein